MRLISEKKIYLCQSYFRQPTFFKTVERKETSTAGLGLGECSYFRMK